MEKVIKNKGITLISLVITIIILLILAGVSVSLLGSNGPITKAILAREQTKIAQYTEQIEMKKMEVRLAQEEPAMSPTLNDYKTAFDKEKWVNTTEIIMDNNTEKLKLVTKDGYIFYITENKTEYKGKGEVVDTGALERDDVLELKATTKTANGSMVRITNLTGVDYYKIQYQIGTEDGEWQEIKSGKEVEVPFGQNIYARLAYGSNYGIIYRLSISHIEPNITVSTNDYSNITRKTNIPFAEIFNITWGSEGIGKINYYVSGTITPTNENVSYSVNELSNISELEVGTYTIKCEAKTPTQENNNETTNIKSATTTVKVTTLASTTVTNMENTVKQAYAIYSKYDLAQFRNLVNNGSSTINAKQMNDIDLNEGKWAKDSNGIDVFNSSAVSWSSIGNYNTTKPFSGIYDGNNKNIQGLYIQNSDYYSGLFGYVKSGIVKNATINGNIQGGVGTGGMIGVLLDSTVSNCANNAYVTHANQTLKSSYTGENYTYVGGLIGVAQGTSTIQNCVNNGIVECYSPSVSTIASFAGGVLAFTDENETDIQIIHCYNNGIVRLSKIENSINRTFIGGVAGVLFRGKISKCYNTGNVEGIETTKIMEHTSGGGIVGIIWPTNNKTIIVDKCWNSGTVENFIAGGIVGETSRQSSGKNIIENCYNIGDIKANYKLGTNSQHNCLVAGGGICGWNSGNSTIQNCYNKGKISGNGCNYKASDYYLGSIGGIAGVNTDSSSINYCYNNGIISCEPYDYDARGSVAGGIVGTNQENGLLYSVYNTGEITWNGNSNSAIGGVVGWSLNESNTSKYIYNIGKIPANSSFPGGLVGYWTNSKGWNNFYWLENIGATIVLGNYSLTDGKLSSTEIKSLISNGLLLSSEWATNSKMNNGYPYLKCFDDTSVWERNASINDGDPYLIENNI